MGYDAIGAVSRSSASRYGIFTRAEATANRLDRAAVARLIRCGALEERPPGVLRWRSSPPSWRQELAAAQAAGGGHGVVSMRSSARLHGLDGFTDNDTVELSSTRRLKIPGAITHIAQGLPRSDLVVIDGFLTTGLARTLCDLGSVVPIDSVERALDSARRRGVSLRWLRESVERLHRPGPTGTGALLRLLDQLNPHDRVRDSWFERTVELMLTDPRIPGLERQCEIRDDDGRFVARADLAVPIVKLAIEAHSRQFHFGSSPEANDEDRDHRLGLVGWEAMYLGHQFTRRPRATLELVARTLEVRAVQLGVDLANFRTRP